MEMPVGGRQVGIPRARRGRSASAEGVRSSPGGVSASFAMLGDVIIAEPPCLRQMIDVFETHQSNVIAIMEVPFEDTPRYGIIHATPLPGKGDRLYEVHDMVEKPAAGTAPSNLAIIGRYVLRPAFSTAWSRPAAAAEVRSS
jgi:UTP-glucose-1-phosphate uridylyltransferase